jgi:hypothetical protein
MNPAARNPAARNPESGIRASPPAGGLRRETALRVRQLTKTEEEERIINNRSDTSTYPKEKICPKKRSHPSQMHFCGT